MIPNVPKNCVVQCRVSSLKQSQEGESLEMQEKSMRAFIALKGWKIVPNDKVWSTAISGRKTDRADFEDILDFIKAHPGLVDYYIFRSIDRFTRAGSEEYSRMKRELSKYGVEIIDTYGVIQPTKNTLADFNMEYEWSKYSPSEIAEIVMATQAKSEVTNILTRMIGQEISLTQQGYRTRRPADGYVNEKIYVEGKKKTIQAPCPNRSRFYISMFELRAQGLSDPECVSRLNAMGYTSPMQNKWNKDHTKILGKSGGAPLTIKQFQKIMENTIYAGVVCEKWTHYKPIKAQYSGLVSIETWNQANRGKLALMKDADGGLELVKNTNTGKSRERYNPDFAYKFIGCPLCGKKMLGSASTGKGGVRRPAYHCSRGHERYGVKKSEFEDSVSKYVKSLKFKPELIDALELTFLNKYRQREKEIVKASGDIHQTIANLELEQASKLEVIETTRSAVVREKFEQEVDALEAKIKEARKERLKIQITRDDIKSFVKEAKNIMEHPSEILLQPSNPRAKEKLFELFFEKMPTYADIVKGTPKLSLVFQLSSNFEPNPKTLVTLRRVELRFSP
jgi:site-specific DNA recombinase